MWPRLNPRPTSLASVRLASIRPGSPGRMPFQGVSYSGQVISVGRPPSLPGDAHIRKPTFRNVSG